MSIRRFEGWYFKHQKGGKTLAVIPGKSSEGAFVQVITEIRSYRAEYPVEAYHREKTLRIGGSVFSSRGIRLSIEEKGLSLHGVLRYGGLKHIRGDIMGPFQFFPMECRHTVISMDHRVSGSVVLNGEALDFDGGNGYIEADSGRSFPTDYAWTHCNDFAGDCSIMTSVARIPFLGFHFWGCICVVCLNGCEYRLATYRGAKIKRCEPGAFLLEQGDYRLEINVDAQAGHELAAPLAGVMSRTILETASCGAHFRFTHKGGALFDRRSDHTSYEYAFRNPM